MSQPNQARGLFSQQPQPPWAAQGAGAQRSGPSVVVIILVVLAVIVVVPGVVVGLAAVAFLVLGFWTPGFLISDALDVTAAEIGVRQMLADSGEGYITDVSCNDGKNPIVEQGATFECGVVIEGVTRPVTVTFVDDDGTYEVGRLR